MGLSQGNGTCSFYFPLLFFMCIAVLFQSAFPHKSETRLQVVLYLGLQDVRENFSPPPQGEGLSSMAWLCLGAGQWRTRTRAWSSDSHAHPCEMNDSSINNNLAGVGEKPAPQGKGMGALRLQESPWSFTNVCGIGTAHLRIEALLELAILAPLLCPTTLMDHLNLDKAVHTVRTTQAFRGSCKAITSAMFCITFLQNPFIPQRLSVSIEFLEPICPHSTEEWVWMPLQRSVWAGCSGVPLSGAPCSCMDSFLLPIFCQSRSHLLCN